MSNLRLWAVPVTIRPMPDTGVNYHSIDHMLTSLESMSSFGSDNGIHLPPTWLIRAKSDESMEWLNQNHHVLNRRLGGLDDLDIDSRAFIFEFVF